MLFFITDAVLMSVFVWFFLTSIRVLIVGTIMNMKRLVFFITDAVLMSVFVWFFLTSITVLILEAL